MKIEAVLPPELRERSRRTRIFAPELSNRIEATGVIDRLHAAAAESRVLRIDYSDRSGQTSQRDIEPLCLAFWGGSWTLGAWCRLRKDFRSFRPDRIVSFEITGEIFADTPERGLAAYLHAMGAQES